MISMRSFPRSCVVMNNEKKKAHGSLLFNYQLLGGVDRDLLAVLAQTLETDNAVGLGKQSVIGAHTDVGAGVDVGAALARTN